jgi:drug/metabolite transporter (DMT)-like permease
MHGRHLPPPPLDRRARRARPEDRLAIDLGGGAASVVLGLASAVAWGAGDFAGGLTSRRAPVFGVVIGSQLTGLVVALGLAIARGELVPRPADLSWGIAAGVTGSIGITALYRGLAGGRMAVVALLAGVTAAALPVLVGAILQGAPGPVRSGGILLGLLAVLVVGSSAGARTAGRADIALGLAAGIGFGLFSVLITRVGQGFVFGPLVAARATSSTVLAVAVAARGWSWRIPRGLWIAVAIAGVLDMAGNGFFLLSAQAGRLDVAAVLSSLYPVTTIVLATVVLGERVTRGHALGIATAGVAIAMIASG